MTMKRRGFCFPLLLAVCLTAGQLVDPRYQHVIQTIPSQATAFPQRRLQGGNCSLCNGLPVLQDVTPPIPDSTGLIEANTTCQTISSIVESVEKEEDCLYFQNTFSNPCCSQLYPPHVCESNVRSSILRDYDNTVMPLTNNGSFVTSLDLYLHHITDLSVKEGTVHIFVWVVLSWKDPRLAWQVTEENCTSSILARASLDIEKTEIFVPDVDLLNQVIGVQEMPDAMATVWSDGTVEWRRNGGLKAFCFFTGLSKFPFDTLGCSFIIGSWTRDQVTTIILQNGTGFQEGPALDRVIYNEYTLVTEQTQTGYYVPGLKSIVYYNFFFERSSRYYIFKILVPTIVFTFLSFGVFFLDVRIGERLSYGITILLVIIAQDISTSQLLPITDQKLWINFFVNGSFYWVLISNLESVFVAWLYFKGDKKPDADVNTPVHDTDTTTTPSQETTPKPSVAQSTSEAWPPSDKQVSDLEQDAFAATRNLSEHEDRANDSFPSVAHTGDETNGRVTFRVDEASGRDSSPKMDRRAAFIRKASAKVSTRTFLTFQQHFLTSTNEKRHETIQKMDRIFFYMLFISYILFIIIMFATNSLWDDGNALVVAG